MLFRSALIVLLMVASLQAVEITTLDGKKYNGNLATLGSGTITISTNDGPLTFSAKNLATVEFGSKVETPEKYDELELTDGSTIKIETLTIRGKQVQPQLSGQASAAKTTLPLESLFFWLRSAETAKNREDWKKLLSSRGKRDLYVIREAVGFNALPGTVISGTEDGNSIVFEREDGKREERRLSRASGGLVFNQPPRGIIPPTLCKVHDVHGNTFVAQTVELTGEDVIVETVSGAKIQYPSLKFVAKLDFTTGNVQYLSDLEPAVTAPASETVWTWLKDKTPEGPGFKMASTTYSRGLWIAPDVSLTYKLNGEYREFKCICGFSDNINVATAAVRLTIEADGKPLFNEVIQRRDKPRELTLDVKNVKQLKVSVDGEGLYLGNEINLAEARLQK